MRSGDIYKGLQRVKKIPFRIVIFHMALSNRNEYMQEQAQVIRVPVESKDGSSRESG